jgi:hypothetical protein
VSTLVPRIYFGELDLTDYPYSIEFNYDLGAGGLTYETLVSLLLDGEIVSATRVSNRELSFRVLVEGADLAEIATNTAALSAECDKAYNTLAVDPGDGFAAITVFETFRAQLTPERSEDHEAAGFRLFELTMPAAPHSRSLELTTQAALPTAADVVIDSGDSLTGWSAESGTLAISSGAVVNTRPRTTWGAMRRAGAIDMDGMPYLRITWTQSVPSYIDLKAGDSLALWKEAFREVVGGQNRSYFYVNGDVRATGFRMGSLQGLTSGTMTFSIHEVARVATLPDSSTAGHQQMLILPAGGAARTQGELTVETETNGLGEVALYTRRAGDAYTPTIRRWLISSDTVLVDPAGYYQTIAGPSIFDVPVSTLPPGGYTVYARMACLTTDEVDIVWNAQTYVGSSTVGDYQGDTTRIAFEANVWRWVPLGLATLPPALVGPAGKIRVGIQRSAAPPNDTKSVYLYDVALFHDDGDLTIVDCGSGTSATGGASRRMRVLPPSSTSPGGGTIEKGHSSDWSDAVGGGSAASARAARGHVIHPEGTSVFVFTEGTPNDDPAEVSASWFKRWPTHAGE